MDIGNIQLGKAPANTKVDLANFSDPLNAVLGAGQLRGGPVNAGIAPQLGASQMGYQNAIANSRMQSMGLEQKMQELQQLMKDDQFKDQQPGLLDFLGLGVSGLGMVKGIDQQDQMKKLMAQNGIGSNDPGLWAQLFGGQ